jgi:uncharacterized protein YoxC
MTITHLLIGLILLLIIINVASIWLTKKGLTKDDNNNMIPDAIEEKFSKIKEDIFYRVERVSEELKDVSKSIKEVGNQIGDVPKAFKGKPRTGRKPQ